MRRVGMAGCSPPAATSTPSSLFAAWPLDNKFDPLLKELSTAVVRGCTGSTLHAEELCGRRAERSAVYLQRNSSECQRMVLWVCAQRGKGPYIHMYAQALGPRGWLVYGGEGQGGVVCLDWCYYRFIAGGKQVL